MIKLVLSTLLIFLAFSINAQNSSLDYHGHFTEKNKSDHRKLEGGNLNSKKNTSTSNIKKDVKSKVHSIIQNKNSSQTSGTAFKKKLAKTQIRNNTKRELSKLDSVIKRHNLVKNTNKSSAQKKTVKKTTTSTNKRKPQVKPKVTLRKNKKPKRVKRKR